MTDKELELIGWSEAARAWSVCASVHRSYCKGRDPFFTTRQADFTAHELDARAKARQLAFECGKITEEERDAPL